MASSRLINIIRAANFQEAQELLSDPNLDLNVLDDDGFGALHYAVLIGHLELVRLLLAHPRCDPNLKDNNGNFALIHAMDQRQIDIISELLADPRTNPNITNHDQCTALIIAVHSENPHLVQAVLQNPLCDPNVTDKKGNTPLIIAASKGNIQMVQQLLEHGANPNSKNYANYGVLSYLIKKSPEESEIKRLLTDYGLKRKAIHFQICALLNKLGYGSIFNYFGVCYGLNSWAMIHMFEGLDGLRKVERIYNIIAEQDSKLIVTKIEHAKEMRKQVVSRSKKIISDNINQMTLADVIHSINLADQNKAKNIISRMFRDNSSEYLSPEDIIDSILRKEKYELTELEKKIEKKLKDYLIQKFLQDEVDKLLSIEYGEDGPLLLEIESILQTITLTQRTGSYKHILPKEIAPLIKPLVGQSFAATFPIISSVELEDKDIYEQYSAINTFNIKDLELFFKRLKAQFKRNNLTNPVTFLFHTETHAFSIGYLPQQNKWIYSDYAPGRFAQNEYDLANLVFKSFGTKNTSEITAGIKIYATNMDANIIKSSIKHIRAEDHRNSPSVPKKIADEMAKFFRRRWKLMIMAAVFGGIVTTATVTTAGLGIIPSISLILLGCVAFSLISPIVRDVGGILRIKIETKIAKKLRSNRENQHGAQQENNLTTTQKLSGFFSRNRGTILGMSFGIGFGVAGAGLGFAAGVLGAPFTFGLSVPVCTAIGLVIGSATGLALGVVTTFIVDYIRNSKQKLDSVEASLREERKSNTISFRGSSQSKLLQVMPPEKNIISSSGNEKRFNSAPILGESTQARISHYGTFTPPKSQNNLPPLDTTSSDKIDKKQKDKIQKHK